MARFPMIRVTVPNVDLTRTGFTHMRNLRTNVDLTRTGDVVVTV